MMMHRCKFFMFLFLLRTTRYNLKLWTYNGPILDGLRQALSEHPEMKAVLMGTRRSDPSGKNLTFFQVLAQYRHEH